jgi:PAS domain S-box-containing protein
MSDGPITRPLLGMGRPPRVLVIDDNVDNRYLVRSQLGPAGGIVSEAADGAAGLLMAFAEPPDLIIADVRMPGMDGYEVVRHLKAAPATRTTPVVLITAQNDLAAKLRGLEAGADDFLIRPIEFPELVARVQSLLRARELYGELARSEAKYRAVVEHIPAVTYVIGPGTPRTPAYVSPQIESMLGVSAAEWLSDPDAWGKLLHSEDREWVLSAMQSAEADMGQFEVEHRVMARDGRVVWGRHEIVFGRDGHVYGVFVDISDRKRAEGALRRNEAVLRGVLQTALDAVIIEDAQHHITMFNTAAQRMFGYAEDYVLGKPFSRLLPERVRPIHTERTAPIMGGEVPVDRPFAMTGRHADGTEFPIEASISRTYVGDEEFSTIIVRDITERVRSEQFKNELVVRLSEQQHAIRRLSTPVLPVRPGLLIVPLIGAIDPGRASQLTKQLLTAIRDNRARVVILDLTGVGDLDVTAASNLHDTIGAARLIGAIVILTGLSPAIAHTLIDVGLDLTKLRTAGDLQRGIQDGERLLRTPFTSGSL